MKFKKYNKQVKFMTRLVKQANKIITKNKMEVSNKGNDGDLVTNLDLAVEKFIIGQIKKNYPTYHIVSEEFNENASLKDNCFTIDPIDGTINFANGLPCWAIQIAYRFGGVTCASVLFIPTLNELYVAVEGEGAYLNGKRIYVQQTPVVKGSIYLLNPDTRPYIDAIYQEIAPITKSHRMFGSESSSLAFVAKGAVAGNVFFSKNIWDIEPGLLLCKEAGGVYFRNDKYLIVACNQEFFEVLKNAVEKHYEDKKTK